MILTRYQTIGNKTCLPAGFVLKFIIKKAGPGGSALALGSVSSGGRRSTGILCHELVAVRELLEISHDEAPVIVVGQNLESLGEM
jgi:hypothetical protein